MSRLKLNKHERNITNSDGISRVSGDIPSAFVWFRSCFFRLIWIKTFFAFRWNLTSECFMETPLPNKKEISKLYVFMSCSIFIPGFV